LRRGTRPTWSRTPLVVSKRQHRLAKIRIGIGGYLTAIRPLVLSRFLAWTAANLIVTTVLFGGLGGLGAQLARGIPRLREVSTERKRLEQQGLAQLPEARVIS